MREPLRSSASTNEYNALKTCSESSPFFNKQGLSPSVWLVFCPLARQKALRSRASNKDEPSIGRDRSLSAIAFVRIFASRRTEGDGGSPRSVVRGAHYKPDPASDYIQIIDLVA